MAIGMITDVAFTLNPSNYFTLLKNEITITSAEADARYGIKIFDENGKLNPTQYGLYQTNILLENAAAMGVDISA
jgi:hypothetical protein